ncbi:MAG: type II secretion system protein [Planctomycetota bacterium]
MRLNKRGPARRFTLIELVVVLAILVILAAGVVAKLDVLQLRANKGVASSDMAAVSRMIQTYVVANNHYPDGFDSLLVDPDGAGATAPNALWGQLDPQLLGTPTPNPTKLILGGNLSDNEVRSLTRMGISTLYDADGSAAFTGFPSDGFTIKRTIAASVPVAILNSTLNGAAAPGEGDADAIMQRLYPTSTPIGTPPANTRVVLFGLGPRSTIVGRDGLMQSAPLYANSGDRTRFYARYLLAFEVSSTGSRARFLGAFGADADRIDEEIQEFYEIQ